ncbi:RDD family protein [Candidatus Peregrinibacteria bacterium]|nr:RDD family protein [Candidatus Peregrinibacteria bacterium]
MTISSSKLAGRGARLVAMITDSFVYLPVLVLMMVTTGPDSRGGAMMIWFLLGFALFIYQMFLLTRDGQTIGKKAMNIKIVLHTTGKNGGFLSNVLLRVFVNGILSIIPFYALIDALLIFREDRRCIHDLLAGTSVVKA